jgi:regulatory protein
MQLQSNKKKLAQGGLWDYALRSLDRRAFSQAELRKKLSLRAESPAVLNEVMAKLQEYGMLDDKRFAEVYAASRLEGQGFGAGRVLRDLRAKRVNSAEAEQAVSEVYAQTDELTLASNFLARKLRGKDLTEYLAEEKHLLSAFRRLRVAGFSSSVALKVLKSHSRRAEELEEIESGPEGQDEDEVSGRPAGSTED